MAVGVASPRAAGAGYDEHGKGGQQSVGEPVGRIKCKPDEETGYGDGYYRRDEERGHSVNRPLDWGLAVLRILTSLMMLDNAVSSPTDSAA